MTGNAKGNTNDEFKTCIDCDESFIVYCRRARLSADRKLDHNVKRCRPCRQPLKPERGRDVV